MLTLAIRCQWAAGGLCHVKPPTIARRLPLCVIATLGLDPRGFSKPNKRDILLAFAVHAREKHLKRAPDLSQSDKTEKPQECVPCDKAPLRRGQQSAA